MRGGAMFFGFIGGGLIFSAFLYDGIGPDQESALITHVLTSSLLAWGLPGIIALMAAFLTRTHPVLGGLVQLGIGLLLFLPLVLSDWNSPIQISLLSLMTLLGGLSLLIAGTMALTSVTRVERV